MKPFGMHRADRFGASPRRRGNALALVAAALCGAGCLRVTYRGADGSQLSRTAVGVNTRFASLDAKQGTNSVSIRGYVSDAAEVARATAAGVAEGLAKGAKP